MLLAFTPIPQPDAAYLAATTKLSSAAADGTTGISSVADAAQTVSFSTTMLVVTTSHWGQPPQVESSSPRLFSPDNGTAGSYTLSFSTPVKIFGVELSQDYFNTTDTLHAVFYDGATQVGSIDRSVTMTQNPSPPNGARLFAAETDGQFTHVVLSKTSASVGPLDMAQIRYALAAPSVYTWDGGGADANWTTAENWDGDGAPTPGSSLVFPESILKLASHNDFAAGTAFHDLTIEDPGYDVTGNAIGLDGAIKASFPEASSTLSLPVQLLAPLTIDVSGGGTLLYHGDLSGAGFGVTKAGPGTVVLFGAGTESALSGELAVAGGTVHIFSDDALPAGAVSLAGGTTLLIDGATAIDNAVALSGGATIDARADATLSGRLSGPGTLTKAGSRALTLANAGNEAAATGGVFVGGGTLAAAQDDALPAGTIALAGGATLRITADTAIDNAIALDGGASIDAATAFTLSGPISGVGGITKLGTGTLTLEGGGDYDYAGATVIDGGRLVVDGSIADSVGLQVNPGATLGGLGRVPSLAVAAGGSVAPGDSPGTLTADDALFAAGSTFEVELEGAVPGVQYDQLIALGAVNLGGATLDVSRGGGFVPAAGDAFTIVSNDGGGAVVGTFAGLPEGAKVTVDGIDFRISYAGGDGNDVVLRVVESASVTVSASPNPSLLGGAVTFSVNVSSATITPTGSVTLLIDGTPLATSTLDDSGSAVFTTAGMSAGSHAVSVTYAGDAAHDPAEATLAAGQVVLRASATTIVTSSANPSVFGQSVTLAATVTGLDGVVPTGVVEFFDGTESLGTVALDPDGEATLTTTTLGVGGHTITAAYSGDTRFQPNRSAGLVQGVNHASTALAVSPGSATGVVGQPIRFTVSVTAVAPGAGTPGGHVRVMVDGRETDLIDLDGSGQGTFIVMPGAAGTAAVSALYLGDANFAAITATTAQVTVNAAATATALVVSSPSTGLGMPLTLAATVAARAPGAGTPAGTVTFLDGGTVLGTASLTDGTATLTVTSLGLGTHSLTARFAGGPDFSASTSAAAAVTVTASPTSLALRLSTDRVPLGQPVTYLAVVDDTAGAPNAPSGTVAFFDNGVLIGRAPILNGVATLTLPATGVDLPHAITAAFCGDDEAAVATAGPVNLDVVRGEATINLIAAAGRGRSGVAVEVVPRSLGMPTPTGTLTFSLRKRVLRQVTLSDGRYAGEFSNRPYLRRRLNVNYSGDAHYNPASAPLSHVPAFFRASRVLLERGLAALVSGYGRRDGR